MSSLDEPSVFDHIDKPKNNVLRIGIQVFCIAVLVLMALYFAISGYFFFEATRMLPNIMEVYEGQAVNSITAPFLVLCLCGSATFASGILFICLRKIKTAMWLMLIGNLLSLFLCMYR